MNCFTNVLKVCGFQTKNNDLELHLALFEDFVKQYCDISLDKNVSTPLSNLLGCYWHYATKYRNIGWSSNLDIDSCIEAIFTILKKYEVKVIGPSYGSDPTSYRTVLLSKICLETRGVALGNKFNRCQPSLPYLPSHEVLLCPSCCLKLFRI